MKKRKRKHLYQKQTLQVKNYLTTCTLQSHLGMCEEMLNFLYHKVQNFK